MINFAVKTGESKKDFRDRILRETKEEARRKRRSINRGEIPVVMDVDDFGFLLPGHDDLLRLKKSFSNFKITAFTIPLPKELYQPGNAKHFTVEKYKKWAEIVNGMEWLEVAIHGFSHTHNEMEIGYDKTIQLLTAVENYFEQIGLKYSKIFKAPFWQYSYDALVALRDKGYIVAIDRNHKRPVPDRLQTYIYNWSFEEPIPDLPIVKGHGHFTGRNRNNIQDTLDNILRVLPKDTKFLTISEYCQKYREEDKDSKEFIIT